MNPEAYTNLIIGSGEGGKFLAWHLASSGQKTAVIERRWIGGSCPNINCLPSKNEIWSAKVNHLVYIGSKFGSTAMPGPVDMSVVRQRKRDMVEGLVAMHLEKYKASGAELIMGHAKFTSPKTLNVQLNEGGSRTLTAHRIFLNLGTHAAIPRIPGLAESDPLTNIEALELDRLPQHLIVIGAGYVGLEFAQAYRRFGSQVTVIQDGPQLLTREDPDVAHELMEAFTSEGIDVFVPTDILSVHGRSGDNVRIVLHTPSGEQTLVGSDILVAAGRVPNTQSIGLDVAGVSLDPRGYIQVNERLETTAPNIWAIGECAGSPQFTHASFDDFRVIRDNLAGKNRTTRARVVPSCLFTDPEVAHIGLSEGDAKRLGLSIRLAKIPMSADLRSRTIGDTRGFMKAILDANSDRILGFTMVGPEAGEVMAVVQIAMQAGLPFTALRDAILTHPTMSEGLTALFFDTKEIAADKKTGSTRPAAAASGT